MFPFQREFGMKHNRQHLKISDDWLLNRNLYNKDTMDSWANFLHFQFKQGLAIWFINVITPLPSNSFHIFNLLKKK